MERTVTLFGVKQQEKILYSCIPIIPALPYLQLVTICLPDELFIPFICNYVCTELEFKVAAKRSISRHQWSWVSLVQPPILMRLVQ